MLHTVLYVYVNSGVIACIFYAAVYIMPNGMETCIYKLFNYRIIKKRLEHSHEKHKSYLTPTNLFNAYGYIGKILVLQCCTPRASSTGHGLVRCQGQRERRKKESSAAPTQIRWINVLIYYAYGSHKYKFALKNRICNKINTPTNY